MIMGQSRSNWEAVVSTNVETRSCKQWVSAPKRITRLILQCTLEDQHRRPAFSQVVQEVQSLHNAVLEPERVTDTGYFAEEILARIPDCRDYVAIGLDRFEKNTPSGLTVALFRSNSGSGIGMKFAFQKTGMERFQNIASISEYFKKIPGIVTDGGLTVDTKRIRSFHNHGDYSCEMDVIMADFGEFTKGVFVVSQIINRLSTMIGRS